MGATVSDLFAEIERCDRLQRRLGELVARTDRLRQLQLATADAVLVALPSKPTRKARTPEEWATIAREAGEHTGRESPAA